MDHYVYFISDPKANRIKIGWSVDIEARLQSLRLEFGQQLTLRGWESGDQAREHELHKQFAHLRLEREWFLANRELITYVDRCANRGLPTRKGADSPEEVTLLLRPGIRVTNRGVEFDPNVTTGDLEDMGVWLWNLRAALPWIIGDWLNAQSAGRPNIYRSALRSTGFSYGTLRNFSYLARTFEPGRRFASVSFRTYQAIAGLNRPIQDSILEAIVSSGATSTQVRNLIKQWRS